MVVNVRELLVTRRQLETGSCGVEMDKSFNTSDEEVDIDDDLPTGTRNGTSKAQQRKSNKPIMEKKRRARINQCLNELKSLILEALKKDPARHSKLEKADILEMTVKHLQNVQRQQLSAAVTTDPTVVMKFKTGFAECAAEVNRMMSRIEGVDNAVRQRLLNHLSSCMGGLQQLPASPFMPPGYQTYHTGQNLNDMNNNAARLLQNLNLVPSRLPTGEMAFVLPNLNVPSPSNQYHMNGPSSSMGVKCVPSMPISERAERLASAFTSPQRNKMDISSSSEGSLDSPRQFTVEIPGSAFSQHVRGSVSFSVGTGEPVKPLPLKREREDCGDRSPKRAKLSIHLSHMEGPSSLRTVQGNQTESDNMWRPW